MRSTMAVLALASSLALTGCIRGSFVQNGPTQNARELMLEEVGRQDDVTAFQMLHFEESGDRSWAMGAWFGMMSFEDPNVPKPAECWTYQISVRGEGGSGSAIGGCVQVGTPAEPEWSWGNDEPNRILGTVGAEADMVEVTFKDNTTVAIELFHAPERFSRAFFSVELPQPVANVASLAGVFGD